MSKKTAITEPEPENNNVTNCAVTHHYTPPSNHGCCHHHCHCHHVCCPGGHWYYNQPYVWCGTTTTSIASGAPLSNVTYYDFTSDSGGTGGSISYA